MEIIRGKYASLIDLVELRKRLVGYESVLIDLGTGDGRFVQHIAQACPKSFVIGIDTCRENLREVSRRTLTNAMFLIANAQALPPELQGTASQVTINFPWGSLLEGLLTNDSVVLAGLEAMIRPGANLEIRLNGGALAEVGTSLEAGAAHIQRALAVNRFKMRPPTRLAVCDLKSYPSTWAKRLAFGRDPRGIVLCGQRR